ncbi:MAG: TIGR03936 family radical SAM-associated protein, partial [Treponema sp.]|nr:TIGR03936 family radical SAM-associated protein [Treponema sp.]
LPDNPPLSAHSPPSAPHSPTWRLLFSFTKEGSAVFHGHLSLIEIFSMAMSRAGLDVLYTQGFNPLAKLEIVSPLSIGISAGAEIAAVDFPQESPPGDFSARMNAVLPEGIRVNRAEIYRIPDGSKKHSLSSLLWGFGYADITGAAGLDGGGIRDPDTVYIPVSGEKAFREQCFAALGCGNTRAAHFSLHRACVVAKNPSTGDSQPWISYFDRLRQLYPIP